MRKEKNESHKALIGLGISAAIGIGILCCLRATRHRPEPVLHKIGKTIVEVGELLGKSDFNKHSNGMNSTIDNCAPKAADVIASFMDCLSTGLDFWKKLK